MTVKQVVTRQYLQISVANGFSNDGTTKTVKRTYKVKTEATADKLYETGDALGSLMAEDVQSMSISTTAELQQEI